MIHKEYPSAGTLKTNHEMVVDNFNIIFSNFNLILTSEKALNREKWANGFENYTFEENNARPDYPEGRGTTTVTVDLDTTDEFVDYMNQTYPKALNKLKELCEE